MVCMGKEVGGDASVKKGEEEEEQEEEGEGEETRI
jgi:hypothetical protein